MYASGQLAQLYGYGDVPDGMVPSRLLSDTDLYAMGLSPRDVRAMENELEEMGLGLGISIKGIFRGIKKVGRGVGRGIGKVGKGVFKGAKFVARTAVKAAPILLPAAGVGFLAVKFGPKLVSKAARLFKKPQSQLTEADVQRAAQLPEPSVIEEPGIRNMRYMPGEQPILREDPRAEFHRKRLEEQERRQKKSLFERIKSVVERAAPLVPAVVEAVAPSPAYAPPEYAPPAGGGAPAVPRATEAGMAPGGEKPGLPPWLLPAAGVAFMLMTQMGGRRS